MTLCTDALISDSWLDSLSHSSPSDPAKTELCYVFYGFNLKNNQYLHVSHSIREVLGHSAEDMMKLGIRWFVQQIHPDDLIRMNTAIDRKKDIPALPWVKYRIRHKDGNYRFVCENRCLLFDKQGNPSHLIGRIEPLL